MHPNWPLPDAELQTRITRLVQRFQQNGATCEPVCRELLALAHAAGLDPEALRQRLVTAGLPASRASELKLVYQNRGVRNKFLAESPQSWRKSLRQARQEARAAEWNAQQITRADGLRAQIAGLMHREGLHAITVDNLELHLSYDCQPVLAQLHPQ